MGKLAKNMLRERMSYCIMCTMYVTRVYAYTPVHLYVFNGHLGPCVPLYKTKQKLTQQ